MIFIFWQNVVSIHQAAFLKALAENNEVILVAQSMIAKHRETEKWQVPAMGSVKIIITPSKDEVYELLNKPNSHHVFSGIDAFPSVYTAFRLAVKKKLPISVFAEPYDNSDGKGFLRKLKYRYLFFKYSQFISHFFATGYTGVNCYRNAGFPKDKLHQWGYFTESLQQIIINSEEKTLPSIIFVGRIIKLKNVIPIVKRACHYEHLFSKFTIIGSGPLQDDLSKLIEGDDKIQYLGSVANAEVHKWISTHDLLILPSFYDGWGAVVNEALMQGTRVLCSDNCGAAALLDGEKRGGTFSLKNNNFDEMLQHWLSKGPVSWKERMEIASWASRNISGQYAASYFCDVIKDNNPTPQWISKSI